MILVDVQLPKLDGVQATARFREMGLASQVPILTTFDTGDYVLDGIRAGARGYLLKDVRLQELFDVVRRVAAGEIFIQPSVAGKYLQLRQAVVGVWGLGQALEMGWTPSTQSRLTSLPRLQTVLRTGAFPRPTEAWAAAHPARRPPPRPARPPAPATTSAPDGGPLPAARTCR